MCIRDRLMKSWAGTAQFQYYAAFAGDTSYAASTSSELMINVGGQASPTSVALTATTTTPAPYQYVTFTATLTSGGNPLSGKSVSIYHYVDNVRYYDITANTDANGQVKLMKSWAGAAQFQYYAATPGDSSHAASTSSELVINVKSATSVALSASTTTPSPYQYVTFTATLTSGGNPLSGKSVSIYHYVDNVRYYDITANTDANGQVKLMKSWAGAAQFQYYAATPGDSSHAASTSSELVINVKSATSVALSASTTTPSPYQYVTFTATLTSGGNPLSGKSVSIYHYVDNVRYYDITANTDANGQVKLMKSWAGAAQFQYYAATPGDSSHAASTSSELIVKVSGQSTSVALSASTTTPSPYQYVTFTATLTSGGNPLSGKSGSIYNYVDNVRYYDITANTDANGQVKLMKSWAGAAQFQYYAATPGDSSY